MAEEFNRNAKPKILRNRARCPRCEDVIESKHVHDYVACSCGAITVDGGRDYLKRGFNSGAEPIEMAEYRPDFGAFPQVKADSWVEHPPGWDAIVVDALTKMSPEARVLQTKSKFGDMRFYIAGSETDMAIATAAESAAYLTCSRCGGALNLEPITESNADYPPTTAPCASCGKEKGW